MLLYYFYYYYYYITFTIVVTITIAVTIILNGRLDGFMVAIVRAIGLCEAWW